MLEKYKTVYTKFLILQNSSDFTKVETLWIRIISLFQNVIQNIVLHDQGDWFN
jgi:hypothetical protein